ncbi:MAG: hypothetical protein QOI73_640 [Solirubrobacteraceae bacterium]|nr:hypothetical protein [Solirubrobacteraceae bacterium]
MSVSGDARRRNRATWEAGDWDAVAPKIESAGRRLLDRLGDVGPGVRLLDVGTGSGGAVAIPAAQRGAEVVGADITDAWFAAARRRAEEAGVEVEWAVGDAVELPFEDASFDIVTSTFGHMFAPDHVAAARELVRVCRPGGTIALACWTPDGNFGRIMMTLAAALPPPPAGFRPPLLWGSEPYVRELLEPLGVTLEARSTALTMEAPSVELLMAFLEGNLGPIAMAKNALGDEGWPAARDALLALLDEINERDDGTMAAEYAYLETIGHRSEA